MFFVTLANTAFKVPARRRVSISGRAMKAEPVLFNQRGGKPEPQADGLALRPACCGRVMCVVVGLRGAEG